MYFPENYIKPSKRETWGACSRPTAHKYTLHCSPTRAPNEADTSCGMLYVATSSSGGMVHGEQGLGISWWHTHVVPMAAPVTMAALNTIQSSTCGSPIECHHNMRLLSTTWSTTLVVEEE